MALVTAVEGTEAVGGSGDEKWLVVRYSERQLTTLPDNVHVLL